MPNSEEKKMMYDNLSDEMDQINESDFDEEVCDSNSDDD
jgi:hypothetical protein